MITEKYIKYAGIESLKTVPEIKFEICGLKNAIKQAEELILRYEQSIMIVEMENAHASEKKSEFENKERKEKKE